MENKEVHKHPSSAVHLAADRLNCYPGEKVTLYLLVIPPQEKGALCQLSMPGVMKIEAYHLPEGLAESQLSLSEIDQEQVLRIPIQRVAELPQGYEICIEVRIETFEIDQFLLCEARLFDTNLNPCAYEALQVAVLSRAKYMTHLPEIFENDRFVNHFLMLIESFWKPVSQQIDQVDNYFDPLITPGHLLPWLSTWVGMSLDEKLPSERNRRLLKSAIMMYQQRGTADSLRTYLNIYTGSRPVVTEKRARNLVLGGGSRLGVETALGKGNQSNTVKIDLQVPAEDLDRMNYSTDMYLQKLQDTVRSLVPAHAWIDLNCELLQEKPAN